MDFTGMRNARRESSTGDVLMHLPPPGTRVHLTAQHAALHIWEGIFDGMDGERLVLLVECGDELKPMWFRREDVKDIQRAKGT